MPKVEFDLVLVSSDHVRFPVNRALLAASSQVFADMLDLASTAAAEMEVVDVDVEESEAILSLVLPYTKPEFVAPFVLDFPASFDVVKAMDKYGIWRGLDAVSRAFRDLYISNDPSQLTFQNDIYVFLFSTHVRDHPLRSIALTRLIASEPTVAQLSDAISSHISHFLACEGRLLIQTILLHRASLHQVYQSLTTSLSIGGSTSIPHYNCQGVGQLEFLKLWLEAGRYTSPAGLEAYVERVKGSERVGCGECWKETVGKLEVLLGEVRKVPGVLE